MYNLIFEYNIYKMLNCKGNVVSNKLVVMKVIW